MELDYVIVAGIAMLIGAFFKGLHSLYVERNDSKRAEDRTAMNELWKINENQQQQLTSQALIIAGHTEDIRKAVQREQDCIQREHRLEIHLVEMTSEIRALQDIVFRLQKKTGDVYLDTVPGVIIADMDGVIKKFSPSLMPLFGYRPEDIEGRNLLMLVPHDLRAKHAEGLKLVKEGKEVSKTPIITYGLNKEGQEVPIVINLEKFTITANGKGNWLSATIRRRAQKPVLEPE